MPRPRKPASPFRYFNSSPEVIRLVVMMYVRFPLSLRNVEDLLFERGIDICHETVRFWWNRFGPMFAADIRRQRVQAMRGIRHWRWHLDEVFVKINGEQHYLFPSIRGRVLAPRFQSFSACSSRLLTTSAAPLTGAEARCAYRAVVCTCVCPKSAPIIGRLCPAATAVDANVWRKSWMRTSCRPARALIRL